MRKIEWVDEQGYKRCSIIRDEDDDSMVEFGIRVEPPPVSMIDWNGVQRDLHNALYDHGITGWPDVQGTRGDIVSMIVTNVLSKRLKDLLRVGGV